MKTVIVVGGGAAGMVAAAVAAARQNKVILIEKNEKLGKKLYITGKGRCNITNAVPPEELIENITGNPFFMYSAFYAFDANATIAFFNKLGCKTKVERGNRVFPVSDKSSDVVRALERNLSDKGVEVWLSTKVIDIKSENGIIKGVTVNGGKFVPADSVIVCTGGLAYPATGSTGDGYKFAKKLGHLVTDLYPSLVSLKTKEEWVPRLQGLSLRNVEITVKNKKIKLFKTFGEMLFTHYGVSGPVILSASRFLAGLTDENCTVSINLKPALTEKELDLRLIMDFDKYSNKDFKNCFDDLLPQKLIPVFIDLTGIDPLKKSRDLTREERKRAGALLRNLTVTVVGTTGYEDAVVTAGGVCVNEVSPATMESKIVKGLFFAGEVLDVDGYTGGYNLQIAFSTGYLAGKNA